MRDWKPAAVRHMHHRMRFHFQITYKSSWSKRLGSRWYYGSSGRRSHSLRRNCVNAARLKSPNGKLAGRQMSPPMTLRDTNKHSVHFTQESTPPCLQALTGSGAYTVLGCGSRWKRSILDSSLQPSFQDLAVAVALARF